MSIYDHDRALKGTEMNIRDAKYCEANKNLILEFRDFLFSEGLSVVRVNKYLAHLHQISGWNDKDFKCMEMVDVRSIVARVERSKWSPWTKHDHKVTIKRFFRWLGKEDLVSWVKIHMKKADLKMPEELLTEAEVLNMIISANHPRDK